MKIQIVTPVYNDWASIESLVRELDECLADATQLSHVRVALLAVDDASTNPGPEFALVAQPVRIEKIEVLRMRVNLGHQRAIALGLAHAASAPDVDAVLVMDSDGEDRPDDAIRLIDAYLREPGRIVLAQRGRRTESASFRIGYVLYRSAFRLLTGEGLPFGNFSVVPRTALLRLVRSGHTWNHFASSVKRSGLGVSMLRTDRGRRYHGQSHMDWVALLVHGLSAMSVHSDRIAARMIAAAVGVLALCSVSIVALVGVRLFTSLAIPGWTSIVAGLLGLGSLLALAFAVLLAFITLQARQGITFVPDVDGARYVGDVEQWHPKST